MMLSRTSLLKNDSPISVSEFYNALRTAWKPRGAWNGSRQRLGLAISGGADSMALAVLCRKLQSDQRLKQPFKFLYWAFIVDHKARDGSSEEASLVASLVANRLDMRPVVLTLQWPPNVQPLTLPNFESEARRLRYQALGRACRDYRIQSLLLAHHEDDQAETILMRLANGHKSMGLQGMKSSSEIPECWGIHGVSQSGDQDHLAWKKARRAQEDPNKISRDQCLLGIEKGGIRVHRPLLLFPKSRLRETCRKAGIQWIEDNTNHDPTFAPRNAIRHIISSRNLPLALQKPALLALGARANDKIQQRESRGSSRGSSHHCKIVLDIRSGKVVIQLSSQFSTGKGDIPEKYQKKKWLASQHMGSLLLRRFIMAVSPQETIPLQNLQSATKAIFLNLEDLNTFSSTASKAPNDVCLVNGFTVGGVRFRRLKSLTNLSGFDHTSWPCSQIWELSRQPYHKNLDSPQISIPPRTFHEKPWSVPSDMLSSRFQLWDGRYWICVRNYSNVGLVVRSFRESERRTFYLSLDPASQDKLGRILKEVAPGQIRWSLPVIATAGDENGSKSEVIALPTLDFISDRWKSKVWWEIRYKNVDDLTRMKQQVSILPLQQRWIDGTHEF